MPFKVIECARIWIDMNTRVEIIIRSDLHLRYISQYSLNIRMNNIKPSLDLYCTMLRTTSYSSCKLNYINFVPIYKSLDKKRCIFQLKNPCYIISNFCNIFLCLI